MNKAIIFDLDSTLVTIEGLDYLATKKGVGHEVAAITDQAMNGDMPMNLAMKQKMAVIKPHYLELVELGKVYIQNLVPGALATINAIKKRGFTPWIVTGNFQPAVGIAADFLGIPTDQVISNQVVFYPNGRYRSFDHTHPLARNGGKAEIVKQLKEKISNSVFIGDSITDLETKPFVDLFIGFGGVVVRPKVQAAAEVYCAEASLLKILPYL